MSRERRATMGPHYRNFLPGSHSLLVVLLVLAFASCAAPQSDAKAGGATAAGEGGGTTPSSYRPPSTYYGPRTTARPGSLSPLSGKAFGIIFGIGVGVVLLIVLISLLKRKQKKQKTATYDSFWMAATWRASNPLQPHSWDKPFLDNAPAIQQQGWGAWRMLFLPAPPFIGNQPSAHLTGTPLQIRIVEGGKLGDEILPEVRFNPGAGTAVDQSVQACLPLVNPEWGGSQSYFEVTVVHYEEGEKESSTNGTVAVGLSAVPAPSFRLPGWDPISIGMHSDDGRLFVNDATEGRPYGRAWNKGRRVIGCGLHPDKSVYFTVDGERVSSSSTPWSTIGHQAGPLYATVGADCDVTVQVNFGQAAFSYTEANQQSGFLRRPVLPPHSTAPPSPVDPPSSIGSYPPEMSAAGDAPPGSPPPGYPPPEPQQFVPFSTPSYPPTEQQATPWSFATPSLYPPK